MPDKRPGFEDFVAAVSERLQAGQTAYGDRSFDLESPKLVDEVLEELEDVAGWSFILWTRLRRVRDVLAFADRPSLSEAQIEKASAIVGTSKAHDDGRSLGRDEGAG